MLHRIILPLTNEFMLLFVKRVHLTILVHSAFNVHWHHLQINYTSMHLLHVLTHYELKWNIIMNTVSIDLPVVATITTLIKMVKIQILCKDNFWKSNKQKFYHRNISIKAVNLITTLTLWMAMCVHSLLSMVSSKTVEMAIL